eukprot:5333501-Amphidinium_carterae.2
MHSSLGSTASAGALGTHARMALVPASQSLAIVAPETLGSGSLLRREHSEVGQFSLSLLSVWHATGHTWVWVGSAATGSENRQYQSVLAVAHSQDA